MRAADSDELAHISTKFRDGGATALTAVEANRLSALHRATLSRLDNIHFQHQLGYITGEFYESTFKPIVREIVPASNDLETGFLMRPSFKAEVDQILAEAEAQS